MRANGRKVASCGRTFLLLARYSTLCGIPCGRSSVPNRRMSAAFGCGHTLPCVRETKSGVRVVCCSMRRRRCRRCRCASWRSSTRPRCGAAVPHAVCGGTLGLYDSALRPWKRHMASRREIMPSGCMASHCRSGTHWTSHAEGLYGIAEAAHGITSMQQAARQGRTEGLNGSRGEGP